MKRTILQDLIAWRDKENRMPLLITGARQVGKTYVVDELGTKHFAHMVKINFEQQREYLTCFDTLYPEVIVNKIYILSGQQIVPGRTLLFLDEIQECPNALLALRYFYEQMSTLHVIAAGSLLEFTLRNEDFRMPVGRVQFLYMYPLSFKEFLVAKEESPLLDYLMHLRTTSVIDDAFHQRLLSLLREYWIVGGMPAVVRNYIKTQNLYECQLIQGSILDSYRSDFGKYASKSNIRYLQRLFEKIPGMIAQHFRYVAVDPHMQSRDIKNALADLVDAGLIHQIFATAASGLPLISTVNEKKFKVLFVDVGLVIKSLGVSADILLKEDLVLINQGNIAEQFVGQELQAYSLSYERSHLYYWEREQRTSSAEVDFVSHIEKYIYPIEVKSGATGRLKSLQIFLEEKKIKVGVRVSQKTLSMNNHLLNVPLYMIFKMPDLLNEIL